MGRIFNDEPRPRALFEDLDEDECASLRRLFPSVREVRSDDAIYELEADVLITRSGWLRRHGRLHVVAFGTNSLGPTPPPTSERMPVAAVVCANQETTLARELIVPEDVRGDLGALVQQHLVPIFSELEKKPTLTLSFPGVAGAWKSGREVAAWCTPFLLAGDGSVLAASFRRVGGGLCWVLPSSCPDPAAWVAAALSAFRADDPDRIPALPAWWEQPAWATPEQSRARRVARELDAEKERVLADLDRRLISAREDVRLADEAAAAGAARLLTADGDELEDAVMEALDDLGFAVKDMDDHFPERQRREDLRVQDSDLPGWEAIVEVKGYTRGAAVNDLSRLARWTARYVIDQGRPPGAQWHVVNAFRETDPSGRPVAIPNGDDLTDFSDDGGVLIDTRELFTAWQAVTDGSANAKDVRESLRATRGRWRFHAAQGD